MTALLLARLVFAAILLGVVGVFVWTGYTAEASGPRGLNGRHSPTGPKHPLRT